MSKRAKILFTLSIALNVLLIGVIGGHVVRKFNDTPWQSAHLSQESQKEMRQAFKRLSPLKDKIWAKKREMHALLLADEFDENAYDMLAVEVAVLKQGMERGRSEVIKDVLSEMSPEERKAFVEHMSHRIEKRMKRHEKWGKNSKREKQKRAE